MKIAETKTTSSSLQKKGQPFFEKGSGQVFLSDHAIDTPFFTNNLNTRPLIQPKLTIGQPDDKYEKEADAMADKVVQRLAMPEVLTKKETGVQTKPLAATITPIVQTKCAACEQEEKLQKKDEEDLVQESPLELQLKPIFESNAEPPDDSNNIEQTFAASDVTPAKKTEDKLQLKQEEEIADESPLELKLKPIFESNAEPNDDENNSIQKKCTECEKDDKIQKKADSSDSQTASSKIEASINSSKGGGSTIPVDTKEKMEDSFGADFSNVRIHTDRSSVQMNKDLHAQAFTHGSDIYFNAGKFDSDSHSGKSLLAHELTHVVQQRSAKVIQRQQAPVGTATAASPPRPDVVYVMGSDTFHRVATHFFRARFPAATFATLANTNLAALLAHLRATFSSPLGNIFIVSHANEDGTLSFGLNASDRDNRLSVVELRNALHPAGGGPSTLTDVSHLVDDQTRVQIKGCDLGRNQEVVELFDEAFGGAGIVTAPTHEQGYSENSAEIRTGTAEAMRNHLDEFEQTLPALPPTPTPVPRGLRGEALRQARADFNTARRLRSTAERERRNAIATERRSFAAEAARLGNIEGTHEALSGPMFQRPGTQLFTLVELRPQIDSLYPHLSDVQRTSLANRLVTPDARPRARALSQGVFRQSGQRVYTYSNTFRFSAPQNLAEAQRAFARMFRQNHFAAVSVAITSSLSGTATIFEYDFTGHDSRRGHTTEQMTFTASSAPVETNAVLIAQTRALVNNPDKFNWRVNENRNASGTITKTVIRERVVAYLHHGSLNASSRDRFMPPETDRRFFAASAFERVQPKLMIGSSDDPQEKQAEAVANHVVQRVPDQDPVQAKSITLPTTSLVQEKCLACEQEENLQKKPDSSSHNIEDSLRDSKNSGLSLPQNTRYQMESSFGTDFSRVRLHIDPAAAQMNANLNAQAFTHGNDIYFNSGKYDTKSTPGKHLLAHELTHVVQQGATTNKSVAQKTADEARVYRKNILSGDKSGFSSGCSIIQREPDDPKDAGDQDISGVKSPTTVPLPTFDFNDKRQEFGRFDATYTPVGPVPAEGTLEIVLWAHITFEDFSAKRKKKDPYKNVKFTKDQLNDFTWKQEEKEKFEFEFMTSVQNAWSSKFKFRLKDPTFAEYLSKVQVNVLTTDDPKLAHTKVTALKVPKNAPRFRSFVKGNEATLDIRDPSEPEKRKVGAHDLVRQIGPFGFNSSEVTPELVDQIKEVAGFLKSNTDPDHWSLGFAGRATPEGSTAYNEKLGEKRSEAVRKELFRQVGWGEEANYFSILTGERNATTEEKFRRVDITVNKASDAGAEKNVEQNVAAHEAGHMFGLGDEYVEEKPKDKDTTAKFLGDKPSHYEAVKKLMGKEAADELLVQSSESIMGSGMNVKKGHYVTFLYAINQITGKSWNAE